MIDVAPCEGHQQIFDSIHWGDHQGARRFCVDPITDEPRCEFYAACVRMTAAEQAGELGSHCIEGTRAGSLYVNGRRVTAPKETGRGGGRQATLPGIDDDAREARAAYKRGDESEWAKAGNRAYERQRWAAKKGGAA